MTPKEKIKYKKYIAKNSSRAKLIKKAVKRGLKEYAETFKRLASS